MSNWWNTPKITPIQIILYTLGIFYFLFISTDFFQGLDDFIKFVIFVGIMLLSYLAGYSAIDSRRLGLQMYRILRDPYTELPEKFEKCFAVMDDILFHINRKIKKNKKENKKKVKK